MGTPTDPSPSFDTAQIPADAWVRVLTGDLPCAKCRYNLRGMSILSKCPECGTPVRGTILATVDPHAREFLPIYAPVLTAAGMIAWAVCCLAAGLSVLVLRLTELLVSMGGPQFLLSPRWAIVPSALIGVASLGALAFVRPHARISPIHSLAALLGVVAHLPMAYLLFQMHSVVDQIAGEPYTNPDPRWGPVRSMYRLGIAACMAVIILGIRPNGRLLVSRSLLMRTGRVDRQTLLVILAAVGLASLGDVLRLGGPGLTAGTGALVYTLGGVVIAVGSLLILLGLIGVLIDVIRLRFSILAQPLHIDEVAPKGPQAQQPAGVSVTPRPSA